MEHAEETDLGSQVAWIAGDLQQSCSTSVKQQLVADAWQSSGAECGDGCACAQDRRVRRPADRRAREPWWRQDDSLYAIDCRGTASRWACASAHASRRAEH